MIKRCKTWLHLSWLYVQRVVGEKRRWRGVARGDFREPKVFYGHGCIPTRHERTGGAMIKFQDLNDVFPNTLRGANILYLVSSAMPLFAPVMVREAKRAGAVFVLNQNGVAYPGWHGPGWEKTNQPMRFLLEQADYVVYQSEFCKLGADRYLGPCVVPWTILHNPVDTTVFTPASFSPEGFRILLAGSHQHFYRVQAAIEMLPYLTERLPDVCLTVAGRCAWHASTEACIAEARGLADIFGVSARVTFFGSYTQTEAPALFQAHHVLLHTKYNDPCPRLVVEAMACGLPVVYSATGGVLELVGNDAGVGVLAKLDWEQDHPPSGNELAKAALQVSSELGYYSSNARRRAVVSFDVKPWVEKHKSIFSQLIMRNNGDPARRD
ncbi:MAG: hypothetical protein BWK76_19210 [Desulfobulbaceae bacterium A2]|nr:MAG: hypothetical protein BWK76_19210 [Desulfobulbaceae bacterium A2]